MFLALADKTVLVDGPSATGVYNLRRGEFHRVSKEAGAFLRSLDGCVEYGRLDCDERAFADEALELELVVLQHEKIPRRQTQLSDVVRPLRPPRFAWIEITSRCNQTCLHCFVGDELNKSPHVSKERIFEYARTLADLGTKQVVLSGGEPTLHPSFEEIVTYLGQFRFRLTVLSNASSSRIVDSVDCLLRNDVTVKIPLLGWGVAHDQMANLPGAFERTKRAILLLKEAGVNIQLGTTVTAINQNDIKAIRAFANEQGLPLEVSPIFQIGWARKHAQTLMSLPMERVVQICQEDAASVPPKLVSISKNTANGTRFPFDPTDYDAVDLHEYLTAHHECGQKIVAILADGRVSPCLLLRNPEHVIGDVNRSPLHDILTGLADRRSFDERMRLDAVPGCRDCEARFVCKAGGCPASAYALTGFVAAKNPLYDKCYYTSSGADDGR